MMGVCIIGDLVGRRSRRGAGEARQVAGGEWRKLRGAIASAGTRYCIGVLVG